MIFIKVRVRYDGGLRPFDYAELLTVTKFSRRAYIS